MRLRCVLKGNRTVKLSLRVRRNRLWISLITAIPASVDGNSLSLSRDCVGGGQHAADTAAKREPITTKSM